MDMKIIALAIIAIVGLTIICCIYDSENLSGDAVTDIIYVEDGETLVLGYTTGEQEISFSGSGCYYVKEGGELMIVGDLLLSATGEQTIIKFDEGAIFTAGLIDNELADYTEVSITNSCKIVSEDDSISVTIIGLLTIGSDETEIGVRDTTIGFEFGLTSGKLSLNATGLYYNTITEKHYYNGDILDYIINIIEGAVDVNIETNVAVTISNIKMNLSYEIDDNGISGSGNLSVEKVDTSVTSISGDEELREKNWYSNELTEVILSDIRGDLSFSTDVKTINFFELTDLPDFEISVGITIGKLDATASGITAGTMYSDTFESTLTSENIIIDLNFDTGDLTPYLVTAASDDDPDNTFVMKPFDMNYVNKDTGEKAIIHFGTMKFNNSDKDNIWANIESLEVDAVMGPDSDAYFNTAYVKIENITAYGAQDEDDKLHIKSASIDYLYGDLVDLQDNEMILHFDDVELTMLETGVIRVDEGKIELEGTMSMPMAFEIAKGATVVSTNGSWGFGTLILDEGSIATGTFTLTGESRFIYTDEYDITLPKGSDGFTVIMSINNGVQKITIAPNAGYKAITDPQTGSIAYTLNGDDTATITEKKGTVIPGLIPYVFKFTYNGQTTDKEYKEVITLEAPSQTGDREFLGWNDGKKDYLYKGTPVKYKMPARDVIMTELWDEAADIPVDLNTIKSGSNLLVTNTSEGLLTIKESDGTRMTDFVYNNNLNGTVISDPDTSILIPYGTMASSHGKMAPFFSEIEEGIYKLAIYSATTEINGYYGGVTVTQTVETSDPSSLCVKYIKNSGTTTDVTSTTKDLGNGLAEVTFTATKGGNYSIANDTGSDGSSNIMIYAIVAVVVVICLIAGIWFMKTRGTEKKSS